MSDPAAALPGDNGTPPVAPAGTLAADAAWAKFDAETQGAFENHGWDQKTPAEAAAEALKSYREAQKFLGVPKDELAIPKDKSSPEMQKLYQRLGAPTDAKGYDFTGVKFADGTELDDAFKDTMANSFLARGIPKDAAVELAKDFVKFMDDSEAGDKVILDGQMAREADELKKSWGSNVDANKFIANQAAQKLGLGPDVLDNLAKITGRVQVAQALLKIGQMMGEDKFVQSPANMQGVMTREQAQAQMNTKLGDRAWAQRLNDGDSRAREEFDALTRLLVA